MKTEQLRHLNTIIEHYGASHQMDKAVEECSELITEVCKFREGLDDANKFYDVHNIFDEIADVEIMINQLKIMFDCFGEVEERIDYKINRQLERIAKGE